MARVDFAFWDALADEDGRDTATSYERHLRLAARIEELGWHSYFVIEHQNAPQGVDYAERSAIGEEVLDIVKLAWTCGGGP